MLQVTKFNTVFPLLIFPTFSIDEKVGKPKGRQAGNLGYGASRTVVGTGPSNRANFVFDYGSFDSI
ncbi:hypothetical protein IFO69_19060 [Echinicola sp. CAU 1574]|uniref:Uncharacterized protein n=1 Tax=Echinicola arenosa TaxID=2774144 RepID=A0ABR9APZ4_9BACT|nr:hypothetical protein [Echinicola arenosa]MBD8490860.1 hypothetical protein [Echinicola arenosa]